MQNIQKHKIGDLIWSLSAHEIGIIIGYFPSGIQASDKYKYSVRHQSGNKFFYTEEMIDDGKRYLRNIYDRA